MGGTPRQHTQASAPGLPGDPWGSAGGEEGGPPEPPAGPRPARAPGPPTAAGAIAPRPAPAHLPAPSNTSRRGPQRRCLNQHLPSGVRLFPPQPITARLPPTTACQGFSSSVTSLARGSLQAGLSGRWGREHGQGWEGRLASLPAPQRGVVVEGLAQELPFAAGEASQPLDLESQKQFEDTSLSSWGVLHTWHWQVC